MGKHAKLIAKILSGKSNNTIRFTEISALLSAFGFSVRINGDHHIFYHSEVMEIINLQPTKTAMTKPYQVRQIRDLIIKYKLEAGK